MWWLAIEVMGVGALPLTRYVFRWLPDEGYAFAKPLGLLRSDALDRRLAGHCGQRAPTIVVIVVAFAAISWPVFGRRVDGLREWWRRERTTVIVVEVLFAVGLVAMALLRAYSADIAATEKPMEFAFLTRSYSATAFRPWTPGCPGTR